MQMVSPKLLEVKEKIETSEVFSVSKEIEPVRYRSLKYELIEDLYQYAQLLSCARYQDKGLEIVEAANACLQSYDREKGSFVHYFSVVLAKRVKKADAVHSLTEARGGVTFPEDVQGCISRILEIWKKEPCEMSEEDLVTKASEQLGIEPGRVLELLKLNHQFAVLRDHSSNEDDPELLNAQADEFSLEESIIDKENVNELLRTIDTCFMLCRKNQADVISKMLTIHLISCSPDIVRNASNCAFFDVSIAEEYITTGNLPTARQIAHRLNRKEASVSRTFHQFCKKIEPYINST